MLRPKCWFSLLLLSIASLGCGGATPAANTSALPDAVDDAGDETTSVAIPVRPRDPAPPALSKEETNALATRCAAIEPQLYDAQKQATLTLETSLQQDEESAAAEEKALAAGLAMLSQPLAGMSPDAHKRCVALFTKKTRRTLFEYEPTVAEARVTIDSCIRRAVAAFGTEKLSFQMGSGAGAALSAGPFCPEDDPIPASLADLPYKSTADDWDTPAWRCLKFGLRTTQHFQIEYRAIPGSDEFACIARLLPRHGGAPIELSRGGRINKANELVVSRKLSRRRMKP